MRATFLLLIGVPILFLGACSNKQPGVAPPPPKKELVVGKWKTSSDSLFLQGFEFGEDGKMELLYKGMKKPITGRYTWSDERNVEVEYEKDEGARQDYEAAAKMYRDQLQEDVDHQRLDQKIAGGLRSGLVDKLPDKEVFRVGINDPKYLNLVRGNNTLNLQRKE
jgi:hypothetical protein